MSIYQGFYVQSCQDQSQDKIQDLKPYTTNSAAFEASKLSYISTNSQWGEKYIP